MAINISSIVHKVSAMRTLQIRVISVPPEMCYTVRTQEPFFVSRATAFCFSHCIGHPVAEVVDLFNVCNVNEIMLIRNASGITVLESCFFEDTAVQVRDDLKTGDSFPLRVSCHRTFITFLEESFDIYDGSRFAKVEDKVRFGGCTADVVNSVVDGDNGTDDLDGAGQRYFHERVTVLFRHDGIVPGRRDRLEISVESVRFGLEVGDVR